MSGDTIQEIDLVEVILETTNSLYSSPEPNVPEAVMTGFLSESPPMFVLMSAISDCPS